MYGNQQYGKLEYGSDLSRIEIICSGLITLLGQDPVSLSLALVFSGSFIVTPENIAVVLSFVVPMAGTIIFMTAGWHIAFTFLPVFSGTIILSGHIVTHVFLAVVVLCSGTLFITGFFLLELPAFIQRRLTMYSFNRRVPHIAHFDI